MIVRSLGERLLPLCAALLVAAKVAAQDPSIIPPKENAPGTPKQDLQSPGYLSDGYLRTGLDVNDQLRVRLELGSTFFGYENSDYRARSVENIEDEIRYSDDRSFFVETRLSTGMAYYVNPEVLLELGFLHRGLWGNRGNDSGTDALSQQFVGYLGAFNQLSVTYAPKLRGDWQLAATFGRHQFSIGGVPTDYILRDTVDGMSVRLSKGRWGQVRGLLDLFTASTLSDQSLRELQLDTSQPDRFFRGQINTLRVGGLYENIDGILDGLTLKAYYFYADIGASDVRGTGADVSYSGALGNFADNDYTYTYGGRAAYRLDLFEDDLTRWTLTPFAEGARSGGIDRKEAVARDVETEGNAFGGGVTLHEMHGLTSFLVTGSYYYFDGASYASDGLLFKTGFVSMNADPVGGLAGARVLGLRPSAAVDASGIRQTPHNKTRYAGTEVIQATIAAAYDKSRVTFKYFHYRDTGETFLDIGQLSTIDPPFGYSRNEFAAEERLGKTLGQELYLGLSQLLTDTMRIGVEGGVILPGAFYDTEIAEVAGDQIGGDKTFWVVSTGVSAWL